MYSVPICVERLAYSFSLPLVPPSSLAFMESALAAAFRTISFPKEDEEADE